MIMALLLIIIGGFFYNFFIKPSSFLTFREEKLYDSPHHEHATFHHKAAKSNA